MKKLFLLFLLSFFFISCDTLFSFLPETKIITEKTTYKSFSNLENPLVVSMSVQPKKYLWGNKKNSYKYDKLGDMFVIYDLNNHEVYDWVFYGDGNQRTWNLPVKVGSSYKRYVNPLLGKSKIVSIDSNKTEVDYISCSQLGLFYNYSTPGKYCVIDSYGYDSVIDKELMYFTVLDTETGNTNKNKIVQHLECSGYVSTLRSDLDGNFWFAYLLDGYGHIAKIDCEKEIIITFDKIIPCKDNEFDSKYIFAPKVLYVDDSIVFINKVKLGSDPSNESRLYIYNIETDEIKELDIKFSKDFFLYRIVKVNDIFYCITANDSLVNIYELDLQNDSIKNLTEEVEYSINFTDDLWIHGSKIYFMDSWNTTNLYYNYFDVDTCTPGEGWYIRQKDILGDL